MVSISRETRLPADAVAVLTLLALIGGIAWERLHAARILVRLDTMTFFLPMYAFLGERLRSGDIPGWNPHQFAGMPFAGDPESGWMYLPAMLLFTLLPPVAAFTALVVVHLALGGLATYAFARSLGLVALPALVAATAFAFSAFAEFSACCTVFAQLTAWLPLALLGVERMVRAGSPLGRAGWWCLTGLAISQMIAGWFGQGAYYGLLTVGGFLAYRTLIAPPHRIQTRLANLLLHGVASLALGLGLAAAGILPRLDALSRSTLAGGDYRAFAPYAAQPSDWSLATVLNQILSLDAAEMRFYAGGATVALAVVALPLIGRRYCAPFFAFTAVIAVVLAASPTPLHHVFYLLPRFQLIHEHHSYRVLTIVYLAVALLAGATVAALPTLRRHRWRLLIVAPLPFLLLRFAQTARVGTDIDRSTVVATVAVVLLLAIYAVSPVAAVRRLVPVLLLLAVFVDPAGWRLHWDRATATRQNAQAEAHIDAYTTVSEAAAFLQARQGDAPVRFFGYEHAVLTEPRDPQRLNGRFRSEDQVMLLLNNRGHSLGLDDIQGYNPLQIARYTTYVTAMNEAPQEYHEIHALPGAFDSPLLAALNARYVVVPTAIPPGRPDLLHLSQRYPTVHADRRVRVIENPDAFPRAWLVHAAEHVPPGQALARLTSGNIDLATTAVLESAPPEMSSPTDPTNDVVTLQRYTPDAIALISRTDAPGMVVLSEVYDPNWTAYVDGEPVPLLVANHTFRAVAVPAGEHTLELRYESRPLQIGLLVTGFTALVMLGVAVALTRRAVRRR